MAIVLYFKMGNFEKLISELFGTIWNETKLAGHLPNRTLTLPQRAKAIPRSAQQRASTSVYRSCSLVTTCSVGCSAMQTMAEIMIGMIKTVMLMSISSLDLGWAPGTGFKIMCSGVPETQHSVIIWHREQTLPAPCHLFCVSLQGKSILPLCFRVSRTTDSLPDSASLHHVHTRHSHFCLLLSIQSAPYASEHFLSTLHSPSPVSVFQNSSCVTARALLVPAE